MIKDSITNTKNTTKDTNIGKNIAKSTKIINQIRLQTKKTVAVITKDMAKHVKSIGKGLAQAKSTVKDTNKDIPIGNTENTTMLKAKTQGKTIDKATNLTRISLRVY